MSSHFVTNPNALQKRHASQKQRSVHQPWGDAERKVRRQRLLDALKRQNVGRIVRRGQLLYARGHKWLRRRRTVHPTATKLPVFIFGSNRSGTQMVCEAIGHSPHGWDYRESEFSPAFKGYYLRADWLIKWLIRQSPAPLVSFGSILDSQFADELLAHHAGAQAVWVYRRYQDAANSSVRNWTHMKDLVGAVAQGNTSRLGARGARISRDTTHLFAELFHDDLSHEDAASLYWYMRNQIYFELKLDQDPRVLLAQYEDTVLHPERALRRIFDFLNFPYDPDVISHIFTSSVGKNSWPGIDSRIQTVCDALTERLDTHYARTSDWKPEGDKLPSGV